MEKVTIEQKEQTVKGFALIHSLLAEGLFPGRSSSKLMQARGFIEIIHAQALSDLEADPEYKKGGEDGAPAQEPATV